MCETIKMPRPEKQFMNNCKIANYIYAGNDLFSAQLQLRTITSNNIFITVDLDANEELSVSSRNITSYDVAVMDAVYTIFISGVATFTPEMIVRIMSGNYDQDVTNQKINSVVASLRKLACIRITIDSTEEYRTRKLIARNEIAEVESYLMPLDEVTIMSANHQTAMTAFKLLRKPALYDYAEKVKQVTCVPNYLLTLLSDGGRRLNDTDDVIIIKRALIRRIESLKNSKSHMTNNTIRYEPYVTSKGEKSGFFKSVGFERIHYKSSTQWRKKRNALHNTVSTILSCYVKMGYISGFETVFNEAKKIIGVKIHV